MSSGSRKTLLLVTHSGKFHCDDCFGYATLRSALGVHGAEHVLLRSRSPTDHARADLVWDVGGICDPERGRFDHHMRDRPTRADGIPYSAAGLLWAVYGRDAVRGWLGAETAPEVADAVAEAMDRSFVRTIDMIDNGVVAAGGLDLVALVEDFNLVWDDPSQGSPAAMDEAFRLASEAVAGFAARRAGVVRSAVVARAQVLAAHALGADERILELDRGMPWQAAVFDAGLPVLYAVYPSSDGGWMVDAMPPEPGSFEQRLPLPEAWRGLRDGELAAACGIPDAVFVHPAAFVGGARSREGAMEMARGSISMPRDPSPP